MASIKDIIGQKFSYLTVLGLADRSPSGKIKWLCQCDCGVTTIVFGDNLKSGKSRSCSKPHLCEFAFKLKSEAMTIHGMSNSKENKCLEDAIQRCHNINNPNYSDWGARGISVCDDWRNNPKVFFDYLLTLPETREQFEARTGEIGSIDRIDVNSNYEPGNIRWATIQEQAQNKRSSVLTEQLVKIILWDYYISNKSVMDIFRLLIINYNFTGDRTVVGKVINGKIWDNINIDKEIAEYKEFGTVDGIVIPKI